jgi:hypothetical protein
MPLINGYSWHIVAAVYHCGFVRVAPASSWRFCFPGALRSPSPSLVESPGEPLRLVLPVLRLTSGLLRAASTAGPMPKRTARRQRRKFFICNAYKKEGDPVRRLPSCRPSRLSDCPLSAVSCHLGPLTVRYHHNGQAAPRDVSSLAATLTKNEGEG